MRVETNLSLGVQPSPDVARFADRVGGSAASSAVAGAPTPLEDRVELTSAAQPPPAAMPTAIRGGEAELQLSPKKLRELVGG